MAVVAGVGGLVKSGGTTVGNVGVWTLSIKGATVKATPFGAAGSWDINVATIKSWTAKVSGWLDSADAEQPTLLAGINNTYTLELDTIAGTHNFSGSAILTGIDPKADSQQLVTVDYSWTGTGAITYT